MASSREFAFGHSKKMGGIKMAENMTPEEVVRSWSDAYVRKDLDATLALMSEDFIRLGDSTHWTPINKQDWQEIMEKFFRRIS